MPPKVVENVRDNISLWGIAWMSFFWSSSSLIAFSILPAFLTDVLGASKTKIGSIEGIAICISFVAKVFSGVFSDYFKNRKPLIVIGTVFSIIIKPMFAVASSVNMVFAARFIDRLSKGIRSAPTDALIADLAPKQHHGKSYGLRQSLYTYGGMFGAFLATCLMYLTANDYRLIFYISTIPAIIALLILIFIIKQPSEHHNLKKLDWHIRDIRLLPRRYWGFLFVVVLLMLARFSEMFVTLRAKELGWSVEYLPMILVLMDLIHATMAFPMGHFADRKNRYMLLLCGLVITTFAHLCLIVADSPIIVAAGVIFIGMYLGITQSLMSALVAESTPPQLKGTAFALYYLSAGTSVLIGNSIAGILADKYGLVASFIGGGGITIIAIIALLILMFFVNKKDLVRAV